MIKKGLALLLAFAMMMSCVTIAASAEYAGEEVTIQVTANKASVNTGEQFTLTVVLKQAVQKLGNLYVTMDYDETKLEFVSATAGALSNNAEDLEDGGNKYVKFVWDTDGAGTDFPADSKVFDVTFAVKTGIASQANVAPALVVDDGGFADATMDMNDIPYQVSNATVEAIAPHVHEKGTHTPADLYCFKAGTVEYWTCTGCDAKLDADKNVLESIVAPATGNHVYSEDYTTEDGKHWKACTTDGCTAKSEEANCSGGEANCVDKAKCEKCGKRSSV